MKFKFLTYLIIFISSHVSALDSSQLISRNGLTYQKFTDIPFTGEVTGQLQGFMRNGKREGFWTIYTSEGQLSSKGVYKQGIKNGNWVYYYSTGNESSKGEYLNGIKNGKWISYDWSIIYPYTKTEKIEIFKDGINLTEQEAEKKRQLEKERLIAIAREETLRDLRYSYINFISARVRGNWVYQGAKDDWGCDVYILQDEDGKIQNVNIQSCKVDNLSKLKSFKNSIERAVYKSSPLPGAPDGAVFDSELLFLFRVN